jgi:restriction system protein
MTLFLLLALGALGYVILVIILERLAYRSALRRISALVVEHEKTLVRSRFQTVRCDDYGNVLLDQWTAEINHFITAVLKPNLNKAQWRSIERRVDTVIAVIEEEVARSSSREVEAFEAIAYPAEYQRFCASEMRKAGWTALVTKAGGDRGVDVIARKDGLRLLLRCKWYTRPVASDVVQEIGAVRGHKSTEIAAVVSNAGYTTGARQLAAADRVLLLHHADLREIEKLLRQTRGIDTRRQVS